MGLFRRREPLHVRLAREDGLLDEEPARPAWDEPGIHGIHRPREWDAVATVEAPDLQGDRAAFVVLAPSSILVEEGPPGVDVLAGALGSLEPPYRAEAVRRGEVWAVAARRIHVVELPDQEGDEIELSSHEGERRLLVDGQRAFGTVPALERPGSAVRAHRLDGDVWEVDAHPL